MEATEYRTARAANREAPEGVLGERPKTRCRMPARPPHPRAEQGGPATPRRDVEADIFGRLELFLREERRLPATKDGKVNVLELTRTLGLAGADQQHFYKKKALKDAVNAIAHEQRLLPIGSRVEATGADKVIEDRLATAHGKAAEDGRAAAETAAAMEGLIEDLREARAEISRLRLEKAALKNVCACSPTTAWPGS